jgi:hypothetical protein
MVTLQFVAEGQAPLGTFAHGIELENGILVQAGNIYWTNSNLARITDSLTLESTLAAVPEPSSLILLAALFGLGLVITRRHQHSTPSNRG